VEADAKANNNSGIAYNTLGWIVHYYRHSTEEKVVAEKRQKEYLGKA